MPITVTETRNSRWRVEVPSPYKPRLLFLDTKELFELHRAIAAIEACSDDVCPCFKYGYERAVEAPREPTPSW